MIAGLVRSAPVTGAPALGRPAIFVDRDGVLIEHRDNYVRSWRDVEFLPGALTALRRLAELNYPVVMVTNQSAIGRGIISPEHGVYITERVVDEVRRHGGDIDAWYLCPHAPSDQCQCRKPLPGMLLQAGQDLGISLARSWMVGDAVSDIAAAHTAGARGILVLTGRGSQQLQAMDPDMRAQCAVVPSVSEAEDYLERGNW